jgi:superfamily II DNA/RNA helicase
VVVFSSVTLADILIVTPGRVAQYIINGEMKRDYLKKIKFLVLDEADR